MGSRDCALEIRAAAETLLRKDSAATRYLFLRSVRKLSLRFNPSVQDLSDSRFARAIPTLAELDERLEELSPSRPLPDDQAAARKLIDSVVDLASKLEDDFLYDSIPVQHVRAASSWSRLSPTGKMKTIIVENADRMQDSARNAFLKVLEEPPPSAVFILTTARRSAIMPTILSRVRTYAFVDRDAESQVEVITRVFRDLPKAGEGVSAYFQRFLPVSPEAITDAAKAFMSAVLVAAIDEGRKPVCALRDGIGPSDGNPSIAEILSGVNKCRPAIVYRLFIARLESLVRAALRNPQVDAREGEVYYRWTSLMRKAVESVDTYNLSPQSALESLFVSMKETL